MKKIMMVCEAFGGGVFAYVSQLCNDMCSNFEVYLVYSKRKQTPNNYKEKLDSRIKLIELNDFGNNIFNVFKLAKDIKKLKKLYEQINPDIVHLHSSIAGGIGRLAFFNKSNIVYTPHGYAHILLGKGFKSRIYYFMEKMLGKSKGIILTCCESEDDESRKFTKNSFFIETGININEFNQKISCQDYNKEEIIVYTLGRICKQKRPEIFNAIAEKLPNVKFIWIGSGELSDNLKAKNIIVTGWMDRIEAVKVAQKASVFILCSYGEAIAMSLLENMYLENICLVSNTIGNKSVIKDGINGYICDTVDDYAKRIKNIIDDYPTNIGKNAKECILNEYNTEIMKQKYIKFYESIDR